MHIYILMGVSGVGKTTIGKVLAQKLDLPFFDADDFHARGQIEKMSRGEALEDQDRQSWLDRLSGMIRQWHHEKGAVLACSALKEKYRAKMSVIPPKDLTWIFLHAEYEIIQDRLSRRQHHFFNADLLRSQYEILEAPAYGIHVDVRGSENEIVTRIMEKISEEDRSSQIGIIGLGVMGKSLALNLASHGFRVSVYNRNVPGEEDIARDFSIRHQENIAFPWFDQLRPFLDSLDTPRKILMMVPAGAPVDGVIQDMLPYLQDGDILMDGGNSHFRDTQSRGDQLNARNLHFFGIGISGGEQGALNGPSLMPGGSREAYAGIRNFLELIAARDEKGDPCCSFVGPGGSGHFVKMVHNGIEYGEMQLIAECYYLLRYQYGLDPEEIASEFEEWNREARSYLLEISIVILRKTEKDGYLLDRILDAAKQKGTGGWSTQAALELGVPLDTITAAVLARSLSGKLQERMAAEKIYGRRKHESVAGTPPLNEAFRAASKINHAIGFDLLRQASEEYHWELNFSEIARVWTNGCIIRSSLMFHLSRVLREHDKAHLLLHPDISDVLLSEKPALLAVTSTALKNEFPVPCLSAAANYLLQFSSGKSSANFIQAQRDFFGAHTYERTDAPRGRFFHTEWEEDK